MSSPQNTLLQRDFMIVLAGQVISLFGNAILRFALPLYLLRESGSAALYGGVSALSFLPMIVMALVGGVLADRVNKKNIMAALDFGVALLCALFLFWMDRLSVAAMTAVFQMLLYGASGAYQPAVQASMPALLRDEALLRGNAAVNMVGTLDDLIGPVIGGVLFGLWGLKPILIVSGVCFVASAVMELFLRIPYKKQARARGIFATAWLDLGQSWRFIRRERPALLRVTAVLALFNLTLSAALVVGVPVIAVNLLGLSDEALGVIQGVMGLGGLCGGLAAGAWARKLRLRHGFFALLACAPAMLFLTAAVLPGLRGVGYTLILAGCFLAMAAASLFTVHMSAAVQGQTPAHLVGKVMSLIQSVAMCTQPLGQALYGALFEALRERAYLATLLSALAAALISLYARGALKRLEQEEAAARAA